MKLSIRIGIFSLLSLLTVACESVPDQMRVLEKSRQVMPAWMAGGAGLKPTSEGIDYILCKDRVIDLTLGLVQAESSVLQNLKFQMYQLIMSHIDSASLSQKSALDLHVHVSQIIDKRLSKDNIKDFYFEKVSVPVGDNGFVPEYYRIYSYAHVEASQRMSIATEVKAFIESYPADDLRSQIKSVSQL